MTGGEHPIHPTPVCPRRLRGMRQLCCLSPTHAEKEVEQGEPEVNPRKPKGRRRLPVGFED